LNYQEKDFLILHYIYDKHYSEQLGYYHYIEGIIKILII